MMQKFDQVWVVACTPASIAELTAGAAQLGEEVSLIYAGDQGSARGAAAAYYMGPLGGACSFAQYVPGIARLLREQRPRLVLLDTGKNGRLAAAHIAAACCCPVLTDAQEVTLKEGGVQTRRMVLGGAAFKTERVPGPAVVCVGPGVFRSGEAAPTLDVRPITGAAAPGIRLVEKRPRQGRPVHLAAARRVVSVGRGLGTAGNLPMVQALSQAIGAEVACSRPVAEEEKWLSKERYVGVSGQMIKPEVYVALGISGQVQHMVGVSQAGTIIAVNRDKSAPIFRHCDFGIVGDLNTVLPLLTVKLQG